MATMADVARRAGVSVATVSHVLNETRPVRPDTRRAVLDAIDDLGYTPNTLARSLVTARTRSIGLAVSAISNPYVTEILQGVESSALERGYGLLIADPHDDPVHERKAVQLLHERRVDGVIVAPSAEPAGLMDYLTRHEVPAVLLDRLVGDIHDQVCAENAPPVEQLVLHLADLGHTRVGLVAGLPGLSTTTERIAGYRAGLERRGLPFRPALLADGHSEAGGAEDAVHRLLASPEPPTAIITANNAMTIGALRALRRAGLSVPGDLALVCFDDFSWADVFSPGLTAISQPSREIGATAVRLLLDRLENPGRPPRTVRLPCTFVHRTSCGCVAEDPDRPLPGTPGPPGKDPVS
ncbi:LacI family DNA-binding transcriptional regulator [Streptomyces hygroscopicus]|uniref:LacI family DNA-binding transcriptional regulator n=1 Tax=Streptomyces hygroscopicus TaxID=1912 RepID=UPI00082DF685|nr:LacI family DNA-binding transcriptional regulator [Streptomyces hygroscopicus]GLV73862.1 LacI family transcriptional regulator [Streptomyces hygroscopicus subsp. hygroscopicus]